ncbi:hypothetical protein AYI68_g3865 [Smittium mucronatum]|uniref:Endonuclease/exonuclease/phosphatase domain-containing protein n=1 Tax=Smittium mucronatum TaxID=133383 RepID=A0A1R0GYP9_9FUNG|nr:hypothetical protein AYI68_g3865 [Smittium mucronatum]
MSTLLKIGYYNCNGLSYAKWNYAVKTLSNGLCDLLFLSETWFVDQEIHQNSQYYVISSINERVRSSVRQKNGIMLLATPECKQHISNVEFNEFTISISLFGHNIIGVYFPPSLSVSEISNSINDLHHSILLGDINTFFGSSFGQTKNRPNDRINFFDNLKAKNYWAHIKPDITKDTPDHAFCDIRIKATWKFYDSTEENPSDHSLMILNSDLKTFQSKPLESDSFRFSLKDIDEPIIQSSIISEYSKYSALFNYIIDQMDKLNQSDSRYKMFECINRAYWYLKYSMTSVSDHVLGKYNVNLAKSHSQSRKSNLKALDLKSSNSNASRIFKKSMQIASGKYTIKSRFADISAVDDAYSYFEDLFMPSFGEADAYVISGHNNFDTNFENCEYFSSQSIKNEITEYSDTNSIWEYPAPILNLFKKTDTIKPLITAQIAGLTWVTGVSKFHGKQYHRLISSLCGIEPIPDRLETLGIKFCQNYDLNTGVNVLKDLVSLVGNRNIFTFPKAYTRFMIHTLPIYHTNKEPILDNSKIYYLKRKLKNISKTVTSSDRIKLINKNSRNPSTLADVSLFLSSRSLVTQAIRWRMSTYGFGTICPVCKENFKYTHVEKCLKIHNFDRFFIFRNKKRLENELLNLMKLAPPNLDIDLRNQ